MKIITQSLSRGLRLTNDRESTEALAEFDPSLGEYLITLREGNEIQTLGKPIRLPGETDDTFYDRACSMAYRLYLDHLTSKIETMSRYERSQSVLNTIRDKLYHMTGVVDNWGNTEPTGEELDQLQQLCFDVAKLDNDLTCLS